MKKANYLQVSWAQNIFYRTFRWMIHPETLKKMLVTQEMTPLELVEEYHPSQLEKRFGGGAETPTKFWPPYIGD